LRLDASGLLIVCTQMNADADARTRTQTLARGRRRTHADADVYILTCTHATHVDARRRTRTHADARRRTQMRADARRRTHVQCGGGRNRKTRPDARRLFKDFRDVLYIYKRVAWCPLVADTRMKMVTAETL